MIKTTTLNMQEESHLKAKHLATFKNLSLARYFDALIERDWIENIGTLPFAEQLIEGLKKDDLKDDLQQRDDKRSNLP